MKRRTNQTIKILFLLFIAFCSQNRMAGAQSFEQKIDSAILSEFKDPDGPGGVFMIAKKGEIIYHKAFGKANVELGVNMQKESVFQIGSMTKQFTAIAILMLEEQGKLKVNDPVSTYISSYPGGDKITLHHLLTHTSGIKDFTKTKAIKEIAQKEMSPEMLVDVFKNEVPDFAPGEKFEYNNSGYVLLGYIIELVSKETYEDFIRKNIFDKAGMKNSRYASDRLIIKNRAFGYHKKETGYVNKTIINYTVPYSSGALMSTSEDLLKWQQALNKNILISTKPSKKAFRTYTLNNGEAFSYGYGWHIKKINEVETREHGGNIFGYKSMGVYIPSLDIYVIGLSNCDCNSPTQLVRNIAALTLTP